MNYLNNEYVLVDDLNPENTVKEIPILEVVTCFYYFSDLKIKYPFKSYLKYLKIVFPISE